MLRSARHLAAALILGALLTSGCEIDSVYARGTPFSSKRTLGSSESERINGWPFVYYNDPDLSVLWPLFEKTPDHLAFRPLASVYKLDEDKREYNVIWPLAQFDFSQDEHRIFPAFWGGTGDDKYFVLFPEVWWYRDGKAALPFFWGGASGDRYFVTFPLIWSFESGRSGSVFPIFWWNYRDGGMRSFTGFPLFWYQRDEYCHFFPLWFHSPGDTDVVWPIFNVKDTGDSKGWRFWPLAGDYRAKSSDYRYSFLLWPLGHRISEGRTGTNVFVPLYYGRRDGDDAVHVTPLFSTGWSKEASWNLLVPLYYYGSDRAAGSSVFASPLFANWGDKDRSGTVIPPLLSWMTRRGEDRSLWAAGPFFHARWGTEERGSHLIPLYYHDGGKKLFLSLPYSQQGGERGFWNALLLGAHCYWDGPEKSRVIVPPALATMSWNRGERSLWAAGPLFHARWGGEAKQNHLLPLYYYDGGKDVFFSPLFARGGGEKPWSLLLPFYYHQSDPAADSSLLLTPLFARQAVKDDARWLALPLLSAMSWDGDGRSLWMLGPLAHARWGGGRLQNHVFPLYYYDREDQLFLSPLYSQGQKNERSWSFLLPAYYYSSDAKRDSSLLVTPLGTRWAEKDQSRSFFLPTLGLLGTDGADRDLWMPGPLFHARWGGDRVQNHLIPLYYYDREKKLLLTLPFSRQGGENGFWNALLLGAHYSQNGPDRSWLLLPPALSLMAWNGADRDLWSAGGLFRARWGAERHQSHLLPLYYYDRERNIFLTLPFSRRGGQDGWWNVLGLGAHFSRDGQDGGTLVLPPALTAVNWNKDDKEVWTLGGLAHARWGGERVQNHLIPLYYYDREKKLLLTLPFSHQGGDDGFWNVLGLLAHGSKDSEGHGVTRVLPPFTAFASEKDYGRASVYPLFSSERHGNRRNTWVLPWMFFESSPARSDNSFFPFWMYDSSQNERSGYRRDFRILGWIWEDHQKNVGATGQEAESEYVRKRVLWKIFDYERQADKRTTLDCFPFITWDRWSDGHRRFAWAWRLFRWERTADGGKKLDILFIPCWRSKGQAAEKKAPAGPTSSDPSDRSDKPDGSDKATAAPAPAAPLADASARAQSLIDEASALYRSGKREEALAKLREAVQAANTAGREDLAVTANRMIYGINKTTPVVDPAPATP